ncbi:PREDICTED: IST1 homolog isoform X1 [Branchiostoma belcheri]|uniref:IST1 homolog n=1 Tax=Branchiostoma belcheri TaxID=7741 RepID=A0A6P4YJ72_BRABE|nr:PREDICTED: IST1 homolog isoform X1 [Branchiostoma belcheri]XP_019629460.1 PREDICTED: IST1 homolog isoform X1 [Branchiostoma belcheri]XP_019629461.1 PREDICTED: IST1 homolog isoform X1 [Branchiostoma belcheri]XP_019629463.1 PREDICTED: IST1 homolog isoform X1 [Branchiostoma belcheri]
MFGGGFRGNKLKTNLRLSINRLKLLEKKKTELAQKARKEIAEYLANGKDERARIRVEHIIREDYLVEAMELIEMYCDLLLARFGLIESMKTVEQGLQEAVSTLIWAAPRMSTEVQELKVVSDQLCAKYGKEFGKLCRNNEIASVNERLMHKMSEQAPPRILVERYLIEIAKANNVLFEPDPTVMMDAEIPMSADDLLNLDIDDKKGPGGSGGGGGGGMPAPPLPAQGPALQPFNYPPPQQPRMTPDDYLAYQKELEAAGRLGGPSGGLPQAPQAPSAKQPPPLPTQAPVGNPSTPAPAYNTVANDPAYPPNAAAYIPPVNPPMPMPPAPSAPPTNTDSLPDLPCVPSNSFPNPGNTIGGASAGGDDVDFDDLTRRFEELKNKK